MVLCVVGPSWTMRVNIIGPHVQEDLVKKDPHGKRIYV